VESSSFALVLLREIENVIGRLNRLTTGVRELRKAVAVYRNVLGAQDSAVRKAGIMILQPYASLSGRQISSSAATSLDRW
jgi:hypothetical protein